MSGIMKSLIFMFLLQTIEIKSMCLVKACNEIQKACGEFRLTKRHVVLGLVIAFCYVWHRSIRRQIEREEAYRRDWTDHEKQKKVEYQKGYKEFYAAKANVTTLQVMPQANDPLKTFDLMMPSELQTLEQIRQANIQTARVLAGVMCRLNKGSKSSSHLAHDKAELDRLKKKRESDLRALASGKKRESPEPEKWVARLSRINELEAAVKAAM